LKERFGDWVIQQDVWNRIIELVQRLVYSAHKKRYM